MVNNFKEVVDFKFTAEMENEFDEIAQGKVEWSEMIGQFYRGFHKTIEDSKSIDRNTASSVRELGIDPTTGKAVSVRLGKYGPYAQLGDAKDEEKPIFVNLPKDKLLSSITLEEALALFEKPRLPREIGFYEDKPLVVGAGKLGPYVKHDDKYVSLDASDDPFTIDEARAIVLIEAKRAADAGGNLGDFEGSVITTGKGRFGPYVKHDNKYYSLAKTDSLTTITYERAIELILAKRNQEANKYIKEFPENESIKVVNGVYGPYIQIGKRNVKIPKDMVAAELTLEDCIRLGEEAPAPSKGRKK